jgi:hypothetical protein
MRIVYREAPEKFRILRTVNHTSPAYAALNAEYEAWQSNYLAEYRAGGKTSVKKTNTPSVGRGAGGTIAMNAKMRREFYNAKG